jgi:long-subunit acyl-CoA synthetase (AMP-forming)
MNFDCIPLSVKKEMLEAMDETNCNAYRTMEWNRDVVDAHLYVGAGVTPTMKLKRKVIATKYAALIDSMYPN